MLYHPDAPWALEGTLGYKFDKVNGSNGTIEFIRVPLDVIVDYAKNGHRVSGGASVPSGQRRWSGKGRRATDRFSRRRSE